MQLKRNALKFLRVGLLKFEDRQNLAMIAKM